MEIPDKRKEIFRIITVLAAGVAAAVLAVILLIGTSSEKGKYIAGNCLLAPEMLRKVQLQVGQKGEVYSVSTLQFAYFSSEQRSFVFIDVPYEKYVQFYDQIKTLRSISDEGVIQKFFSKPHSALTIHLAAKSEDIEAKSITFLQVQFAEDLNVFRIQLREGGQETGWAYFQIEQLSAILSKLKQ